MREHRWKDDPSGSGLLVCSECGECCWPGQGIKGYYHMRARDSATGLSYSWVFYGPKPDYGGAGWPGPSKPEDILVVEQRTLPVAPSCDEYLISEIMDS